MEVRAPPPSSSSSSDHHHRPSPPPAAAPDPSPAEAPLASLPLPPGRQPSPNKNTYVVQVARDQVYRVPPPENAYLVEQYLKRPKNTQGCKGAPCYACLSWAIPIVLVFILIAAIAAATFYAIVRPQAPDVTISHIAIKQHGRGSKPEYDITLKVKNPSAQMGYRYLKGATTTLSLHGSAVATAKSPGFEQDAGKSSTVKLSLSGNETKLPSTLATAMKSKKAAPGGAIAMKLSVAYDARGKVGFMEAWVMKVEVKCKLRVGVSSKGSEVVDQDCEAKLH